MLLRDAPDESMLSAKNSLESGWAWWPADHVAWMQAACLMPQHEWAIHKSGATILLLAGEGSGFLAEEPSAPEAALAFWEGP